MDVLFAWELSQARGTFAVEVFSATSFYSEYLPCGAKLWIRDGDLLIADPVCIAINAMVAIDRRQNYLPVG